MADIWDQAAQANSTSSTPTAPLSAQPAAPAALPSADIWDQAAKANTANAGVATINNAPAERDIWDQAATENYNTKQRPLSAIMSSTQSSGGTPPGLTAAVTGNPDSFLESEPQAELPADAGPWDKLKYYAGYPIFGVLHRAGAGPIEKATEEFVTGNINPLNITLAVASGGGSLVEEGLTKAGMTAVEAARAVRFAKAGADIGFLGQFGVQGLPEIYKDVERSWQNIDAAKTPQEKKDAIDSFKQETTKALLTGAMAAWSAHGVAEDIHAIEEHGAASKATNNKDYMAAAEEFSGDKRTSVALAEQLKDQAERVAPTAVRRGAMSRNYEVGGDPYKLAQTLLDIQSGPFSNDPKLERALYKKFEIAQDLRPEEKTFLNDRVRAAHDWIARRAASQGDLPEDALLPNGQPDYGASLRANPTAGPGLPSARLPENYLHHTPDFQDVDPTTGEEKVTGGGSLDFTKKRGHDTMFEGEKQGVRYKSDDIGEITSDYVLKSGDRFARNKLADSLVPHEENGVIKGYANSGEPLGVVGGFRAGDTIIPDRPKSIALSKEAAARMTPDQFQANLDRNRIFQNPKDGSYELNLDGYRDVGLKRSKYVGVDENGKDIYVQAPIFVSPEVAGHLENMLKPAEPGPIFKKVLRASTAAKNTLLGLSPFHIGTIFERGLESGLGPKQLFTPDPVDYLHLTASQHDAIYHGLVTASMYGNGGLTSEGSAAGGKSPINSVLNALGVGKLNEAINDRLAAKGISTRVNLNVNELMERFLFGAHGYITKYKFETYDKLVPELAKANPKLSPDEVRNAAAAMVNNKYGGLNYELMGRSMKTENVLRAALLAPDFLESTARSMMDVLSKNNALPLLEPLLKFQVAQYALARVGNYITTGEMHPETGFAVQSKDGKKQYGIRSTVGDFLHFLEDPRNFAMNRMNPLLLRTGAEAAFQENQFGRKVTPNQQVRDLVNQFTPIPLQGHIPFVGQTSPEDQSKAESALRTIGIQETPHRTPAEQELVTRLSGKNESGALEGAALTEHQDRLRLEQNVRDALTSKDPTQMQGIGKSIQDAVTGPNAFLTPTQAKAIEKDALLSPIQSGVKKLPLTDAYAVWAAANTEERQKPGPGGRTLRGVMDEKINNAMKELRAVKTPPRQARAALDVINAYMKETRPGWKPIPPEAITPWQAPEEETPPPAE